MIAKTFRAFTLSLGFLLAILGLTLSGPARADTVWLNDPVTLRTSTGETTFAADVPVTLYMEIGTCCPAPYPGTLTVKDGETVLGTVRVIAANGASLTVTFPTGATPVLTAYYSGDPDRFPATSNTLILTELVDTITENLVLSTAQDRMRHLFLDQPDLTRFLAGGAAPELDLTLSGKNDSLLWSGTHGPLWFRLTGSHSDDGTGSSHYALLSLGTHATIGDQAILGVMGQFDSIGYSDPTGSVSGTGWLAGPYGVTRLGQLPLWLEGRLLWGQSRNYSRLPGRPEEEISGDRFLGLVKLTGDFTANGLSLRPYLSLGHGTESFDPYTTSQGLPILGASQTRSEASLGLDLSKTLTTATGTLLLDGGLGLVGISEDAAGQDATTARFRLGLDHVADSGLRTHLHLFGQGGGSSDSRTLGLDLGLAFAF